MPSLRQIRRRIRSVENTKKITRAMEMVAAAKLRRFEELLMKAREAAAFLDRLLRDLLADVSHYEHPLFERKSRAHPIGLVLFTSDAGLCGTYNANVIQQALAFLREHADRPVTLIPVGKNGMNFFAQRGEKLETAFSEIRVSNFEVKAKQITDTLVGAFLGDRLDEIHLMYTHYVSKASFKPKAEKFLNLDRAAEEGRTRVGYILEPNADRIFEELLPRFLLAKIRTVLLESSLSEQISRMIAMRQATDNASEMIEDLTLLRNKLRQASITKELIEVVSGAKALKR